MKRPNLYLTDPLDDIRGLGVVSAGTGHYMGEVVGETDNHKYIKLSGGGFILKLAGSPLYRLVAREGKPQ